MKTANWYQTYIDLINQGYSQRKAAKHMGIPRTTIQHWLNNFIQEEDIVFEVDTSVDYSFVGNVTEHENQRILLISDMHIPYHHPDTLDFLSYLKAKYKPTRVICLGDELDKHSLSYHEKAPELPSAMDELKQALPVIAELHKMFPKLDLLDSNHGSLVYRKAKTHGIPKHYIKSYNDVLSVGDGWRWHFDLMITLPDGNKCYLHHGKAARCLQLAEKMGCCAVEGHYHNSFSIEYYSTPFALNWAMQCGCLIDFKSLAFSYANVNIKRPVIGTGLIIDSLPVLMPMLLGEDGMWVKPSDYDTIVGVRNA